MRSASDLAGIFGCDRRQFSSDVNTGPRNRTCTAAPVSEEACSCMFLPHAVHLRMKANIDCYMRSNASPPAKTYLMHVVIYSQRPSGSYHRRQLANHCP